MTTLTERLTWKEIVEKYPDTWIGLKDIIWEDESNIESAVVKFTDKTKTELLTLVARGELEYSCYTTPDNVFQLGAIEVMK